jgi:hypothetical protein
MWGLFGTGILNTDGDEWKAHRALTRPFFGTDLSFYIVYRH